MTAITQTRRVRIFEDVPVKDGKGRTIGHVTVKRNPPLPADKRRKAPLTDKDGNTELYLVSVGQVVNPDKYMKRRMRKVSRMLKVCLHVR